MSDIPPLPEPPPGTAELFGAAWPQAQQYAELLATQGVIAGVVGPREVPRIWERHLRNSVAVSPFVGDGVDVVDLGSGAGLPGIPLALARPDLAVTLLEPLARRVRFLQLAADLLPPSTRIMQARADAAPAEFATVVCRAVAPLPRLAPMARGLLHAGTGQLVALKGRTAADEVDQVRNVVAADRRTRGWAPSSINVHDVEWPDPATVVVAQWTR